MAGHSAATQPLPFNVICRGPQKFGWAEIPLADIKAVKNAFAVTVNDVALALVTSAFQHYGELRGVRIKGRLLRIVVPVNVRGNGNAGDLGNRITFVPGPTTPLYLLGHKMLRCFPYVPIGGDLGINCAVLTYNDTAYFGLTADVHAAPDVGRLERFLNTSFAKLSRAAGCRPQRRSR